MTYSEKLRDPRWQRRRLEIMQRADFGCELCSDKTKTLNVHHKAYVNGREPWEYPDAELECLCEDCHKIVHMRKENISGLISDLGAKSLGKVSGYAAAQYLLEDPARSLPVKSSATSETWIGFSDAFHLSPQDCFKLVVEGRIQSADLMEECERQRNGKKLPRKRVAA